jgi:SAM-dependent methyltransferase
MTETFVHAARIAYDRIAADYAENFSVELRDKPLDRALLTAFAELVRSGGGGPVADIGSGPGHVTAQLRALGLDVFGIDVSPEMLAQARAAYPELRFDEGSMTGLDLPDGGLAGITALYSTIHIPTERLPEVFGEFRRVLAPGGHLLLAFQVGDDERRHRTEAFGHPISLHYYLRRPEAVAELLAGAGLPVLARLHREPGEGETAPRAYLLAG